MSLFLSLPKPLGAWLEEMLTVEDVLRTPKRGFVDVAWGRQEISLACFERWGSLREEARVDGCERMVGGKKPNPPSILLEHTGACLQGSPVSRDEAARRNWSSSEGMQQG